MAPTGTNPDPAATCRARGQRCSFAPARVKLRSAPPPEGWGAPVLQQRLAAAWVRFIAQVHRGGWVQVVEQRGAQAALQASRQMLAGSIDARQGLLLAMH